MKEPAYIVDQEYRGGEPAEIVGFGYHDFRGISQSCFETRFDDGEERLVPMKWITDQIIEVCKGDRELTSCHVATKKGAELERRVRKVAPGCMAIGEKLGGRNDI